MLASGIASERQRLPTFWTDSITESVAGEEDELTGEFNTYPEYVGLSLGSSYAVANLGVSGSCLLRQGLQTRDSHAPSSGNGLAPLPPHMAQTGTP